MAATPRNVVRTGVLDTLVNDLVSVRFDYEASSTIESGESVVGCALVQGRRITTQ